MTEPPDESRTREADARELLDSLCNFAYEMGFHECGYIPQDAYRDAIAARVKAETIAEVRRVGTEGVGVVSVEGRASTRVFTGSDAPRFAAEHARIVNARESAIHKPWTTADVLVIPLAALDRMAK